VVVAFLEHYIKYTPKDSYNSSIIPNSLYHLLFLFFIFSSHCYDFHMQYLFWCSFHMQFCYKQLLTKHFEHPPILLAVLCFTLDFWIRSRFVVVVAWGYYFPFNPHI